MPLEHTGWWALTSWTLCCQHAKRRSELQRMRSHFPASMLTSDASMNAHLRHCKFRPTTKAAEAAAKGKKTKSARAVAASKADKREKKEERQKRGGKGKEEGKHQCVK